ncbi:hypothetical protein F2Q70_00005435 [Brassica cretica]|uniref:Uncharacterized protein n=1 Tax=Brassica cretica TaxID=69181 RepID=A0A8S9IMV4_BRACR|nr:hypothetical protein F2Q70_00005435 [Brassica cretica]
MVYISLLEQQSKYKDALEVLSGNLGSLLVIEVDKLRIQGRLLARARDYSAAVDVYKKILELSPDDWECFLQYLSCLFEDDSMWKFFDDIDQIHPTKNIECKFSHLTEEMFDSRISSASELVQKLQRDTENSNLRGPHLAEIEIEKRKFLYGKKNDSELLKSLLQYFLKFGHLACYASDVEAFLQVLPPHKKAEFVGMLVENADSVSASATTVLGQTTTILKVQELTGNIFELPLGEIEASAVKLAKLYCQNLPLSKDLDPQESMFGEELLSLINNMLVQLYWRTRDFCYLAEAIMVLELGLAIRGTVQEVSNWLLNKINNPEDDQVERFLTTLKRNEGPGQVLGVLESFIATSEESEVGSRIFESLKTWSKADSARKTVTAQQRVLREFLQICESKRKLLEKLKQQMTHV